MYIDLFSFKNVSVRSDLQFPTCETLEIKPLVKFPKAGGEHHNVVKKCGIKFKYRLR